MRKIERQHEKLHIEAISEKVGAGGRFDIFLDSNFLLHTIL